MQWPDLENLGKITSVGTIPTARQISKDHVKRVPHVARNITKYRLLVEPCKCELLESRILQIRGVQGSYKTFLMEKNVNERYH